MNLLIIAVAVALVIASALRLRSWYRFWKAEGRKLQQSGYLPPEPTWLARIFFRLSNRLLVWLAIGPVKVIGRENARKFRGRLLVTPNHIQAPDWALVNQGVDYQRYTAVASQLKGTRGRFSAWTGCFGVNTDQPGGGDAFRQACVSLLATQPDCSLLYFPQGKLVADNILRKEDFRFGAARVLRTVAEQVKDQPVAFLPVAIRYKGNLGEATCLHQAMLRFGQKWFRNLFGTRNVGAVVVVGQPITVDQLPADADPEHPVNATEFIRQRIQELLDIADRQ